jgi:hypothetical protein
MKKIIFLLVPLGIALFYSMTFAQGWNSTVTTSISESTLQKMDQFTNKNGNHLLIKKSNGNIVYHNINSPGTVDNNKTVTLESNGDFPTICGTNDIVYAFYKAGSYIKLKYSTNGGSSWTYNSNLDLSIGSNECNGIDAIYDKDNGVHLVWAALDSDPYFETYYYNLKTNLVWDYYKNVTDYSGFQYGGRPTVAFSDNRVHVSFGPVSGGAVGDVSTRDRYNGSWQTPQNASGSDYSSIEKLITSDSYLYMVYSQWVPPSYFDLAYKSRTFSGTWSSGSGTDIETNIIGTEYTFVICRTYNSELQLVYELDAEDLLHRSFNGSWSDPAFEVDNNQYFAGNPKGISNAGNDFFVLWKRQNSNSLYYRQYDALPLAPQGLAVQPHQIGNTVYAKLTWQFNIEPDVFIKQYTAYEIWRRILYLGNWSSWSLVASKSGTVSEFIDNEIQGVGLADVYTVEYKMKARDYNNYVSGFSSTVSIEFQRYSPNAPGGSGSWVNKSTESGGNNVSYDYALSQNYPNPFNPTTTINYSIKTAGEVTLKVYDMLGTEVASLVNEIKEAGNYSVEFNAVELPSGIYVYRLSTNNFVDTKKLILLK